MRFVFLFLFGILLEYCKSHDTDDKLRQVCRDNEDNPVPWERNFVADDTYDVKLHTECFYLDYRHLFTQQLIGLFSFTDIETSVETAISEKNAVWEMKQLEKYNCEKAGCMLNHRWYIYKPPADVIPPYSGKNFTYITPDTEGRWTQSEVDITDDNMISYTLMPDYKQRSYMDKVGRAVVKFEAATWRRGKARTSARGVVMAGPEGGFLITHSVPEFPGSFYTEELFPTKELANGHLLTCITLTIGALKYVGRALKEIAPNFTLVHVPDTLKDLLPSWQFDDDMPSLTTDRIRPSIYFLVQRNQSGIAGSPDGVAAALVARPRGVKSCIYSSFAARQMVMLNVYGQSRSKYVTTTCGDGFGVRNLDSLCLKYKGTDGNSIYYVTNSTDHTWFAVSTAAHWQQKGAGPRQFWVCSSQVDKEDLSGEGGLLLCVIDYNLWVAFDNLKVAEPSC